MPRAGGTPTINQQEADVKFIHTGDIHWGMCPDANKPWGKERAQAIKDTFRIIIEHTKEMDADCLFISGTCSTGSR